MLYPRQTELLALIDDAVRRTGSVPNGRELAGRMGLANVSAVYAHLRKLEAAGFVTLTSGGRGVPLQIELTKKGERQGRARPWPRLGSIPAGPITDVQAQADDFVTTLPDLVPQMKVGDYLLVVEGESMLGAGLRPGMTLIMRPDVVADRARRVLGLRRGRGEHAQARDRRGRVRPPGRGEPRLPRPPGAREHGPDPGRRHRRLRRPSLSLKLLLVSPSPLDP